jgi:hypothetical protein
MDDFHGADARIDRLPGLQRDDRPAIARYDLVVAWFKCELDVLMNVWAQP